MAIYLPTQKLEFGLLPQQKIVYEKMNSEMIRAF